MFSKALFKQSCKANGTMWSIITAAVCFMLACVMLISGNGNIGAVKDSIQDTIIEKEINSQLEKRAINYYVNTKDGLEKLDEFFVKNATETLSYTVWYSSMPLESNFENKEQYNLALKAWNDAKSNGSTSSLKQYEESVNKWQNEMPSSRDYNSTEEYMLALSKWKENTPVSQENAVKTAYTNAILNDLTNYIYDRALSIDASYTKDSIEAQEMLGTVMFSVNPTNLFDNIYTKHNEVIVSDYDILSLVSHIASSDINTYLKSEERIEYINDRASYTSAIFLANNMTDESNVTKLLEQLKSFGVDKEKYDTFNYTYDSIKHMAKTATITYCGRVEYELSLLKKNYEDGKFESEEKYQEAIINKQEEIKNEISSSLLASLPTGVSDALEEVGKADLYTLIVGSIFYKLAGLLLPIIYMIMASNNLISNQVDSGSMAYVLSTSTKRKTVVFTQAVYLIGSLLLMFALTSITGCVCLAIVKEDVPLTYGKLLLLNVGAFLVLFALSGLCFFTSCFFDRSKRSMAIGGGLSIFALVAAMLGLFGSKVIPSVVRLDALNNFNYVTIISLFDVISIMNNTSAFIYKFLILLALGLTGYVFGLVKFTKKDLPL